VAALAASSGCPQSRTQPSGNKGAAAELDCNCKCAAGGPHVDVVLVSGLVVLAALIMVANQLMRNRAQKEGRAPRMPWYVVALLLVLIAVLFFFRLS
jgi:hypothetical protein